MLLFISSAGACPPDEIARLAVQHSSFQAAQQDALARLRQKDPQVTHVDLVTDPKTGVSKVRIHRGPGVEVIERSYFDPYSDGRIFTYDAEVPDEWQRNGLNRLMVARYLNDHPEIEEARLSLHDSNRKAFVDEVLSQRPTENRDENSRRTVALATRLKGITTPGEVKSSREAILSAIQDHTPAGKIQKSVGMGAIKTVLVSYTTDLSELQVMVDFVRDGESPPTAAKVYVAEANTEDSLRGEVVNYRELLPDGRLKTGTAVVIN